MRTSIKILIFVLPHGCHFSYRHNVTQMKNKEIIRPLSPSEAVFVNYPSGCTVIGACELNQTLNINDIKRTLSKLKQIHPLLTAAIEHDNDQLIFVESPDAEIPIKIENANSFDAICCKAMNHSFDSSRSLSVCFYGEMNNKSCLVFLIHHSISDGAALNILLEDFLDLYDNVSVKASDGNIPKPIDYFFPQDLINVSDELRTQEQNKINALQPSEIRSSFKEDTEQKMEILNSRLTIPKPLFSQLCNKAKKNSATVNSFISAAVLLAVYEIENSHSSPKTALNITIKSAVDLRRRLLEKNNRDLISAVTAYNHIFTISESTNFWELSKHIKKSQHEFIINNGAIKSAIAMISATQIQNANVALMISNTGIINAANNQHSIRVLDARMHAIVVAPKPLLTLNTVHGNLNIEFSYSTPYTSSSYINALKEKIFIHLEKNQ